MNSHRLDLPAFRDALEILREAPPADRPGRDFLDAVGQVLAQRDALFVLLLQSLPAVRSAGLWPELETRIVETLVDMGGK